MVTVFSVRPNEYFGLRNCVRLCYSISPLTEYPHESSLAQMIVNITYKSQRSGQERTSTMYLPTNVLVILSNSSDFTCTFGSEPRRGAYNSGANLRGGLLSQGSDLTCAPLWVNRRNKLTLILDPHLLHKLDPRNSRRFSYRSGGFAGQSSLIGWLRYDWVVCGISLSHRRY
jgi:hypothetical protein